MIYDRQVTGGPDSAILITQGEYAVADRPDMVIRTLLGSCVACCIWDDEAGVGGMNHLLLAGELGGDSVGYDLAGVAEMEYLINGIIKLGGRRDRLKAKVFGGSKMLEGLGRIGEKNARFAFDYLSQEAIPCLNSSVGGTDARALRFWPGTGRVTMRMVTQQEARSVAAVPPPPPPRAQPAGNDLELF
jgi:chemotaxis protein CheD